MGYPIARVSGASRAGPIILGALLLALFLPEHQARSDDSIHASICRSGNCGHEVPTQEIGDLEP